MTHDDPPMRPPVLRVEPGCDRIHDRSRPLPFGASTELRASERTRLWFAAANEPPDEPA